VAVDAGGVIDAGVVVDAGQSVDAGVVLDAGITVDAGTSCGPPVALNVGDVTLLPGGCADDGAACSAALIASLGGGFFQARGPLHARSLTVREGAHLVPVAFDGTSGGELEITTACGNVVVENGASLSAAGLGYGGGGGGGGRVYADSAACEWDGSGPVSQGGGTGAEPSGLAGAGPGYDYRHFPPTSCVSGGGRAGGSGGTPGVSGGWVAPFENVAGGGGQAAGPWGGVGGLPLDTGNGQCQQAPVFNCTTPERSGRDGLPGGYLAPGSNGDSNPAVDDEVYLGSGGGGGGGGWQSGGWCCGGGLGGSGGLARPMVAAAAPVVVARAALLAVGAFVLSPRL
jgi:hypothetical protein